MPQKSRLRDSPPRPVFRPMSESFSFGEPISSDSLSKPYNPISVVAQEIPEANTLPMRTKTGIHGVKVRGATGKTVVGYELRRSTICFVFVQLCSLTDPIVALNAIFEH